MASLLDIGNKILGGANPIMRVIGDNVRQSTSNFIRNPIQSTKTIGRELMTIPRDAAYAVGSAPAFYLKTLPYAKRQAQSYANRSLKLQQDIQKLQQMGDFATAAKLRQEADLSRERGLWTQRVTTQLPSLNDISKRIFSNQPLQPSLRGDAALKSFTSGARTALVGKGLQNKALLAKTLPVSIGLSGGISALTGGDLAKGIGSGITAAPRIAGLNSLTQPGIDRVFSKLPTTLNKTQQVMGKFGIGAGTNLAEDQLYTLATEGRLPTAGENAFSVLMGGFSGTAWKKPSGEVAVKFDDNSEITWNTRAKRWQAKGGKFAKQAIEKLEETVDVPVKRGEQIVGYIKVKRLKLTVADQTGGIGANKPDFHVDADTGKLVQGRVSASQPPKGVGEAPNINSLRQQVTQELEQNRTAAQLAQEARSVVGDNLLTKINQLKKVARNKTFAQGDIETLRSSKYGKLVNEVVESVQEQRPDLDEAGALDFALALPTKAETRVRQPAELKTLRELESRQKLEQKLWEQDFGRTLKEDEFRRMEREWVKSYTGEAPTTIKQKVKQEVRAVRDNEQALRKLEQEWLSSYRQDAPQTAKQKNISDRADIRANERVFNRETNQWTDQANPGTIKPYKRGDLGTQQPFAALRKIKSAKDKSAFLYARETAVRNIEDTFGTDAPRIKEFITDKITANETNSARFVDEVATRLRNVVKKNGIRKNSNEDKLVFAYAEGRITPEQLQAQTKNWKGIIETAGEFRKTYDELLDRINASLAQYGYDPIPKRANYMTHFQEVGNFFENFGAIFQDKSLRDNLGDKLPTGMSGINMDTKPGKSFFSSALPRTGDEFTPSAIGAMERYLTPAARQIFHTDSVQRVRALQNMIEQYAGESGRDLSNFNSWLSEYGNLLAGKKSVIDRPIEKVFGRGFLKAGNWIRRRTGANMVGGNLSSALTNFIPLTQAAATTSKPSLMRGLLSSMSTDVKKIDGVESNFLTRRFQDASIDRSWLEKGGEATNWLFKSVDHFTSRLIVGSKYYEGLSKGLDAQSAMHQADEYAARLMADRSFGATPTLFNSQVLGALTQFQLEVNNQLSFIFKDVPKNLGYNKAQVASSIGQLVLYSYLFNNLYEKYTGRRPAFDPMGLAINTYQDYTNPGMKKGQATKNLIENASNQLPFTSMFTGGRLPIGAAIPNPIALAQGESTLKKELIKPATYLLPPFGGGQIKKTLEGAMAYGRGASITDSGRVRYPIAQTPGNLVRTGVFGQYATPEAQNYFRTGASTLGEKQSMALLTSSDKVGVYNDILGKRSKDKQKDKIKEQLKQSGGNQVIDNTFIYINDKGEAKEIDLNRIQNIPTYPELTGDDNLDKEAVSRYKSELSSITNDVYDLWQMGKLTTEQAAALLDNVQSAYDKTKKPKKPKKITIKKVKATPFKLVKGKRIRLTQNKKPSTKVVKTKGYRVLTYTDNTPTVKTTKATVRWS